MKALMALLVFTIFVSGCAYNVEYGKNRTAVGQIEALRTFQGTNVPQKIFIDSDENGNAILFSGRSDMALTLLSLPPKAQEKAVSLLKESFEWGEKARSKKLETEERLGSITVTYSELDVLFASGKEGAAWNSRLDFCVFGRPYSSFSLFKEPCIKTVSMELSPDSTEKLAAYLSGLITARQKAVEAKDAAPQVK